MTHISLYNSMSREKEKFKPIDDSRVTMYYCGITPYDKPHLGNVRASITGDMIYRLLRVFYKSENVIYARNITDIDDKIEAKSQETGRSAIDITNETIQWFHETMKVLHVLPPDLEPRVSDNEESMMDMINILLDKNIAYKSNNGDIYFELDKFPEHGKLCRHSREDLNINEEHSSEKKHPQDFVLWKENHQRFGWHIECSAMIKKHLGDTIDIHGGGGDLRFPHHENEIAQSETANGVPLANYWMHNGMITVNGKKMAKSTGSFITVDEALDRVPGEAIRFYMLKTHYRKPFDWSWDGLMEAKSELDGLYRKMQKRTYVKMGGVSVQVLYALADDLNTPLVISELYKEADKEISSLLDSAQLLGILNHTPEEWFHGTTKDSLLDASSIEALIEVRKLLKENGDYESADITRDILLGQGIILEDKPDGTTWRKI